MVNSQTIKDLKRIEKLLLDNASTAKLLINTTHSDEGWDSMVISAVNPEFEKPKLDDGAEDHYQ